MQRKRVSPWLKRGNYPLIDESSIRCGSLGRHDTSRPYQKAISPEAAVAELTANVDKQFDPDVVALFLKSLQRNRTIES